MFTIGGQARGKLNLRAHNPFMETAGATASRKPPLFCGAVSAGWYTLGSRGSAETSSEILGAEIEDKDKRYEVIDSFDPVRGCGALTKALAG